MKPLFQVYLEKGYHVFAVRHGSSPKYTIPEAVSDVRRAVRFVRQNAKRFHIDADRLGVMGMSAGGHLSLMLGTTGDDGRAAAKGSLEKVSSRVADCATSTGIFVQVVNCLVIGPDAGRVLAAERPLDR